MGKRYNVNEGLDTFQFFQCPKDLFLNEEYLDLCNDAKVLYMLMYDTNKLSIENDWFDSEGDIFIYFSLETIVKLLNVGKTKAVKLKKDLVNKGLIEEVRQGLSKPNRIYVNKVKFNIENYRVSKNENQDFQKTNTNNNEKNNNENNNIISMCDKVSKKDVDAVIERYKTIKGVEQHREYEETRRKAIRDKIKKYGLATVMEVLDKVEQSAFLTTGKNKKTNIDFIFKQKNKRSGVSNFIEILENKYKDKNTTSKQPKTNYNTNNMLG